MTDIEQSRREAPQQEHAAAPPQGREKKLPARDRLVVITMVTIPLLLALALGAIGVIPDRTALGSATTLALMELAAAGAYAARRQGAGAAGTVASAAVALALGLLIVVLKVIIH